MTLSMTCAVCLRLSGVRVRDMIDSILSVCVCWPTVSWVVSACVSRCVIQSQIRPSPTQQISAISPAGFRAAAIANGWCFSAVVRGECHPRNSCPCLSHPPPKWSSDTQYVCSMLLLTSRPSSSQRRQNFGSFSIALISLRFFVC